VLPFAQPDFRLTSVDFGQDGAEWRSWRMRFDRILQQIEERSGSQLHQLTQEPYLGSSDLFGTANAVLQGLAVLRARERASEPTALVLLDSTPARPARRYRRLPGRVGDHRGRGRGN